MTLYNDDCLNILKTIKDNSIDCVVSDPPYRIMSRGTAGNMGGYMTNDISKSGKIFTNNDIDFDDYLPELYRVLKDGTHCYLMINNYNLIELLNKATLVGFKFVKSIIWDKRSKICGQFYMGCYEYILMFRKGTGRPINNPSTPDILSIPINKLKDERGKNLHDTEKPVELMKVLIENSTNENDIVLDPFMGSGSTGKAVMFENKDRDANYKFIGVEMTEEYLPICKARIDFANDYKDCDDNKEEKSESDKEEDKKVVNYDKLW